MVYCRAVQTNPEKQTQTDTPLSRITFNQPNLQKKKMEALRAVTLAVLGIS